MTTFVQHNNYGLRLKNFGSKGVIFSNPRKQKYNNYNNKQKFLIQSRVSPPSIETYPKYDLQKHIFRNNRIIQRYPQMHQYINIKDNNNNTLEESENSEVNAKISILISYLCLVGQFVVITVALPAMVADPNVSLTSAQAGGIMTTGTIAATAGKLFTAIISSKLPSKIILISVLFGTCIANTCMSFGTNYSFFILLWTISRFFHAGGWVSSAQLTCQLVPETYHGQALGTLAFASRVGATMGTSVLGGLLILGFSWRSLFIITSTIAFIMIFVVKYFVPDESKLIFKRMLRTLQSRKQDQQQQQQQQPFQSRYNLHTKRGTQNRDTFRYSVGTKRFKHTRTMQTVVAHYDPEARSKYQVNINQKNSNMHALNALLRMPEIWLMIATRCMLQLIMEFQGFISLMSVDWLQLTPGQASQVSAGFSMGAAVSVLLGGTIYSKLNSKFKQIFITSLVAGALICIIILGASSGKVSIAVPALVLLGSMFAVPFYIPMSSFNMKKGGKNSGSLEAFSETFAYSVAFAFSAVLSGMIGVGGAGWSGVVRMLSVTTSVGLVLMCLLMRVVVEEEESSGGRDD